MRAGLEHASVAAPLTVRGNRLGWLVLGDKLSEEAYSVEDRDLVRTAAQQAAVAARLHETHRARRRAGGAQARTRHRARRAGRPAAAEAARDRRPRLRRHVPHGPRGRRRLLRLPRPWRGPARPGARRHLRKGRLGGAADGQPAGAVAEPCQAGGGGSRLAGHADQRVAGRVDGLEQVRHVLLCGVRPGREDADLRQRRAQPAVPLAGRHDRGVTAEADRHGPRVRPGGRLRGRQRIAGDWRHPAGLHRRPDRGAQRSGGGVRRREGGRPAGRQPPPWRDRASARRDRRTPGVLRARPAIRRCHHRRRPRHCWKR